MADVVLRCIEQMPQLNIPKDFIKQVKRTGVRLCRSRKDIRAHPAVNPQACADALIEMWLTNNRAEYELENGEIVSAYYNEPVCTHSPLDVLGLRTLRIGHDGLPYWAEVHKQMAIVDALGETCARLQPFVESGDLGRRGRYGLAGFGHCGGVRIFCLINSWRLPLRL